MLIVLMYHRVQESFLQKDNIFEEHLTHLSQNYPIVSPGDKIQQGRVNVCLTFDDAYFDFYHVVFPILKKLNIPATLAIPVGLILENTQLPPKTRLQVPYRQALASYATHATLCTWPEINEMIRSQLVIPASHGLIHIPLNKCELDQKQLEQEIVYSKQQLQEKTQSRVETFIYPHGSVNRSINKLVSQHYRYAMRIGSAFNLSWRNMNQMIYRVNAEKFWPYGKRFTGFEYLNMGLNFLSNTLRFK